MKKSLTYLLPLIGLLSASCSSSTKNQEFENNPTQEYSAENQTESAISDTEYEEEVYESGYEEEMSDGVNIEELDYLTRQFYLGHDPDESEQAILDSIANEFINEDTPKSKYLITNNSAGYFRIDGTVKETNNEYYKLKLHVGAINMVDAASIAGCFLDKNNGDDSQSDEINGCTMPYPDENTAIAFEGKYFKSFEEDDPQNDEYKNDTSLYLIQCENTSSWYRKDSIESIVIHSEDFKTQEGISVGSTFEELRDTYGDLFLHIGWIESNERVEVRTAKYPMVRFIFKDEDVIDFCRYKKSENSNEQCEEDGFNGYRKEDGSGIKPNSKIWRIIINRSYVTCPDCL